MILLNTKRALCLCPLSLNFLSSYGAHELDKTHACFWKSFKFITRRYLILNRAFVFSSSSSLCCSQIVANHSKYSGLIIFCIILAGILVGVQR